MTVVFPFSGSDLGGSHISTFLLGGALQRDYGLTCLVLCPKDTLIAAEAARLGFRVLDSGEPPRQGKDFLLDMRMLASRRRLVRAMVPGQRAIFHCHDMLSLRAWVLPARLEGHAAVYHHHAIGKMWWVPNAAAILASNAVICVSEGTFANIRLQAPNAVTVLNPFTVDRGCDPARAKAALLDEFGWPATSRLVGWVGNLWTRKRPAYFLKVAAEMARQDPSCRFVMFGRKGDIDIADARALASDLGIDTIVAFPGFRSPIEANIGALDLLIAPAPREPFGRTLVEAMLLGVPFVATEGGGHSEIVQRWRGGVLAPTEASPAETAALSAQVLRDPGPVVLDAAMREKVESDLSVGAHAAAVYTVYSRLGRPLRAAGAETKL